MIDIHSHILPAVDDGAQNLEDALALLVLAEEDGVTTQVLTPHMRPTRYINDPSFIRTQFLEFSQIVKNKGLKIKLHLSAEVRVGPEVMMLLRRDDFPWLGSWDGKKAFLLEMPHSQVPAGTLNLIKWLVQRNILPIIVHPERNREFQANKTLLQQYIDAGCKAQLTAASLSGKFGEKSQTCAIELLEKDLFAFMATDSHNSFYRPPDLSSGYAIVKDIVGEEKAWSLVSDAPAKLLQQQIPHTELSA